MRCPRCQRKSDAAAEFCAQCGTPLRRAEKSAEPDPSYADLRRSLSESLEQQTATADILSVISSSPTDLQPVFDAIAASATRLCDGVYSVVFRYDGELITVAADNGRSAETSAVIRSAYPAPPGRGTVAGRALLERRVIAMTDAQDSRENPDGAERARALGYRAGLSVPMMRGEVAIGAINVVRVEAMPFSHAQIELLKTFADQAVIAIENVRLFTELGVRNRELTDSLTQQTATGDILRVISGSPTDIQPVLEAVTTSAARLCEAPDVAIFLVDGRELRLATHLGPIALGPVGEFTVPLVRGSLTGRATLERRTVQLADHQAEEAEYPEGTAVARRLGVHTMLAVPLLRSGEATGVIALRRTEVRLFTDQQVALLQTFADQAVIAIENVRLFTELEARNRDLTATSEILQTISRSPTDVQPVFDTILASALRLMRLHAGTLTRVTGDYLDLAAFKTIDNEGEATLRTRFPLSLQSTGAHATTIRDRAPINIADAQTGPEVSEIGRAIARAAGYQSMLVVPLLQHDEAIGTIAVTRREPGGFSDDEIALLQTFADQAVIAIENVRLFKELEARTAELTQSVEKLTALGEISQAVNSTLDVETVLDTIVARATQLAGADGCAISEYDDATEVFHVRATHGIDAALIGTLRAMPLRKGEGAMGRAAETREPAQIADIAVPGAYQKHFAVSHDESRYALRDVLIGAGFRAILSVPLLREEQIIGSLSLTRKSPGEFPIEVIEVLKTFATQSALAIQNARLFREIADKGAELEAASRHKSEFLANMSHELRTPLNAIIGFSEVLSERMFGELNEKQEEYLKDIYSSGQHLLSLINDILDLSKIEAGRMELEVTDFDLPSSIDNALILVRERASRRGIRLGSAIDERVGMIRGDERKVKQVLLNLLSNALKFTPEGGRIDVRAAINDGMAEISVADTGVGIAPEDQEAIFEEFRQVGTADKKVEGTGLGLALSRKFIELHGGRIWVESQPGKGSTFSFTLPAS
ncbi:MAG TPA: GAF domain-containing protein [Gemmatimonadales bacterium]|nr:GAF domain-containing protein [Gemmatimonadales bacterium]